MRKRRLSTWEAIIFLTRLYGKNYIVFTLSSLNSTEDIYLKTSRLKGPSLFSFNRINLTISNVIIKLPYVLISEAHLTKCPKSSDLFYVVTSSSLLLGHVVTKHEKGKLGTFCTVGSFKYIDDIKIIKSPRFQKSQSTGSAAYRRRLAPKIWKQKRRISNVSKIFIQ